MLKEIKKEKEQFSLMISKEVLEKLKVLKETEKINITDIIEYYVAKGIDKDYPNLKVS